MDVSLNAEEQSLIETAVAFARDHVAPHAAGWETDRRVPLEAYRTAADLGLTGLMIPPELGGRGASHVAAARVLEEIAADCFAFAMGLWVQNNVANGIVRNGTPAQIDRFVPSLLKGERIGAFCLTEPHAGSDATAITTAARHDGDVWELNGEKEWVIHGTVADVICIYAQTDPELGWRGIAAFIVEGDTPGLQRKEAFSLMGGHAIGTNGLILDQCRIPEASMLAGPGDGFKAAMAGINRARTFIAAKCCGVLRRALRVAVDYAGERQAFGQSVLEFQGVQWELADVATDLEAARLLTYRAAQALDGGEEAILEASHAKKFASERAIAGVSACMHTMGATGFSNNHPLVRQLANAKMAQYLDGTTGIQNVIIGRELLDTYGTPDGT